MAKRSQSSFDERFEQYFATDSDISSLQTDIQSINNAPDDEMQSNQSADDRNAGAGSSIGYQRLESNHSDSDDSDDEGN